MKKFYFTLLAFSCIHFLSAQNAPAWHQKVSASLLEKTADGESAPFFVLLKQQADVSAARGLNTKDEKAYYVFSQLKEMAVHSQKNLSAFLKSEGVSYQSLFIVNAIQTEGTQDLIHSLAERTDVAKILKNSPMSFAAPVEKIQATDHSRSAIEWGIDMINANDVWDMGFRGQGVVVGGEDTGYDWTHPALKKQYRGYTAVGDSSTVDHNYAWHDAIHSISPLSGDSINPCGLDVKEPCDDYGHGTHTMGTMIGLDGDNQIGVAPESKWCACRNMERGNGSPFTYLECFEWFLAPTDLNNENPDPTKAPHVINNSWGCPPSEGCDSTNWQILDIAVNNLRLAGTVVVVSAGNSGSGCSSVDDPPAMFENSFSVGATAENDTIAGFSSRGPVIIDGSNRLKPNVSAPGVRVRSSIPGGQYANYSGTSMAGPHVAGAVALIISANPELAGKVELIEDILEKTAVPKTTDQFCGTILGSEIPNHTYGFGRIDVLEAVKAALALIETGTNEQGLISGIAVYPNPVNDFLQVDIQNGNGDVIADVFDTNGKLVAHQTKRIEGHSSFSLDLSANPSGIYFYHINSNGRLLTGKVIKK
ncbi:MAG TPA: S8 family serine peptidase [Saprospiraceae bacterium]|nr:S8 family serine peptidase [Saprospiraceae bacterium]